MVDFLRLLVSLFPGNVLGPKLVAIFAIFTSITVAFSD
jgi:hypothetical protein